ncbi:acyl-[acyl-carrier-protein]--UDP-N-acetylglucosamine O-acyltransferase [Nautilia profundicola AmH]|uniref:Acyl-[acyl-carrier-protein]--UDP-N-acetylglucosamine O-acyltransferase n=1 Tax=Nautilia profundicola (strain ATCC BAA-1463 / DSM 18972 / AmH) TaxID=598659 RepID=LPXA_NAUPA|nr:acyl-ACP--UDP-N-acetylglucosamine O-acyltransferase [Nautilia profundicola]B9L772.1 RecName: Full=Acyl-[acyl-carrier-protein]--UDP-N-acetylglucosamine O-acyltransferase; Short=UDP-N-acetylglucosamine acyltransferase [Nautilia profundicola AmH]ACM93764.1 acyl-[acyl-carrier-protein]--UDP-N-acetylglucosamine O-acyltransferase [Nautilia profundicola AmH]
MENISEKAIIKGKIGKNCKIGEGVIIDENVVIGDNNIIDPYTIITGYTTIGDNNHIYSHAVLGSEPQDLKYHGEKTELIIGNNNKIREFTLINPGTEGGGAVTKIGDNNLLMGYVHVAHDVIIANNCILANAATLAGHVELEDYVVIGGMTPVHQFVKIGAHAMIGGASAVAQDIPPFTIAEGNRAKLRGLNLTGLRRRFQNRSDIDAIKKAYKELFESGKPLKDTAKEILESTDNEYVKHLCEFVLNSKRGIPYDRKV